MSLLESLLWMAGLLDVEQRKQIQPVKDYSSIFEKTKRAFENKKLYLSEEISIEDISREAGTNRTYMSRALSEAGVTFNSFITDYRINEARSIMIESVSAGKDITVEEIAVICGFGSSRALYRHFKKAEGVTPAKYIKMLHAKRAKDLRR